MAENNATIRYMNPDSFTEMLTRLGVAAAERNGMTRDGLTTMESLVDLYEDDVEEFECYLKNQNKLFGNARQNQRIYYTPLVIQRLTGVMYYFNHAVNTLHAMPDVDDITLVMANGFGKMYNSYKKSKDDDDNDGSDVTLPTLNGASNWVSFRDNMIMKLSLTIGCRGIALDYVIDQTERAKTRSTQIRDEINVDDANLGDYDYYRSHAVHFGDQYKKDNSAVWTILKNALLNTPCYNHISSFNNTKNGRKAWFALRQHYQGEDFEQRLRDAAFVKLTRTFYKGETNRFSFEKYVDIHKEAHKMLEDAGYNGGQGLDDATKVQHFKTGIQTDAGLEHSLSSVRANPRLQQFTPLVSFLSAEVEHKTLRKQQLRGAKDRQVSQVKSDRGGGKNGNGNGQGNGKNVKSAKSKVVDGVRVYARRYDNKEFGKLTKAQRQAVIQLNREARGQGNGNTGDKPKQITVAAMNSFRNEVAEDMVTLGEAIIAGVKQASSADTDTTANSTQSGGSGKRGQASSGSVGEFMSRAKRLRSKPQE